jgi:hypothetical protein
MAVACEFKCKSKCGKDDSHLVVDEMTGPSGGNWMPKKRPISDLQILERGKVEKSGLPLKKNKKNVRAY